MARMLALSDAARRRSRRCAPRASSPAPSDSSACGRGASAPLLRDRAGRASRPADRAATVQRRDDRRSARCRHRRRRRARRAAVWQPPPSAATTRAFGVERRAGVRVVDRAPRSVRRVVVARISTATMPWPGAGTHDRRANRRRDARAEARAAAGRPPPAPARRILPPSSLRSRVSTLPRIGANARRGKSACSCAMRRTLPVPMVADVARAARSRCDVDVVVAPADWRAARSRRADLRAADTAAIARPSGQDDRHVLALCTARSMSPRSSASSISLTNRRLPPISDSGAVLQPVAGVLMMTISAATARRSAGASATACGLPQRELAAARRRS